MSKYNDTFKLNLRDIELIELAVRKQISALAQVNLDDVVENDGSNDGKIREYQELLGKLHNQKIWYGEIHHSGVPLG